ncbi:uncharacterized protein LOC123526391 [Mercenaria mercenaria]|uniref:uncharacterized protein LOC123526391 n=1 Tax=Mercenaria mercenaria TaxID=6596 RepID=UPI00234EB743|nr:uncharacterized protein LOC123526391 [Mercenaria mercenaria]
MATGVCGNEVKSQVYAQQKKICCGGELHDLPKHHNHHGPDPKCCGVDVIFDPGSSFCCNNKTYQQSEQFAYCDDNYGLEVAVGRGQIVCKQLMPNRTLYQLHRWQTGYECCGTNLFNTNSHFCQGDEIWPVGVVISECGEELYDQNKYICCEDTSELIPKPGPDFIKAKYLEIETDFSCLNGTVVNKDLEHIVENNNKKSVVQNNFLPCGDDHFDPENKRTQVACCNGVVNHAKPGMNVTCCGSEFIDTDLYKCCNDVKIGATKLCCGNQIYERTSGLECCGTKLINNSYLCCEPQSSKRMPVKKKPGHNRCCGKQTFYYDPNGKDECCGGMIIKLEQNQVCKNDHIVTFSPFDPEEVKDQIKKLPSVKLPGENLPKGIITHACPSCTTYSDPPKQCVKKFEYQVYIRNISTKRTSTIMDVLFLEPNILSKVKMVFRTKGHCRCFKVDEVYLFQTNRNIRAKVTSGHMKLRFSKKDIFHLIKGKFPKYKVDQKCTIDRYYRKPIVS